MKKYQMTKEGLAKVQAELEDLYARKQTIVEKIKTAKEQGDLKENAEYHEAKNDMELNDSRIAELEDMIRNSDVVTHKKTDFVSLGSKIRVQSPRGEREFTIVGQAEADPKQGKISDDSPLGSAFMNRKEGEEFQADTPGGKKTYKILEILA